ncbi:MAG TPA: hypothetical protein VIY47_08225, partial [Ignavibacteriaceae bacterium]
KTFSEVFPKFLKTAESNRMEEIRKEIADLYPSRKEFSARKKLKILALQYRGEEVGCRMRERELVQSLFVEQPSPEALGVLNAMKYMVSEGKTPARELDELKKSSEKFGKLINYGDISVVWRDAEILANKKDLGADFALNISAQKPDVVDHPVETNAKTKVEKQIQAETNQMGLF